MDDFYPRLMRPWSMPFLDGDGGGGSGGGSNGGNGGNGGGDGAGSGAGNGEGSGNGNGGEQKPKDVTFTAEQQEKLNELIGRARQEGHDSGKTTAEQAIAAKKAKDDGDFKTAAEIAEKKAADLEAELKQTKREALVSKIAAKHKLPDELAARLQGETEDDLDKDAKALAKVVQPKKAPNSEAGEGDDSQPTGPSNRPVKREKKPVGEGAAQPAKSYTFDRRPKVSWDQPG